MLKNKKYEKIYIQNRYKPTGSYSSFFDPTYNIKWNKIEVGYIEPKFPHRIHLRVIKNDIMEDGNPNCEWKWITLKRENNSVQEAKDWINSVVEEIHKKYNIVKED